MKGKIAESAADVCTRTLTVRELERRLPPEWRTELRQERRAAEQAATVFARICGQGVADQLYDAHLLLNERGGFDGWRLAMAKVAKLPSVSPEIQAAFLPIWIESKMLPLRVGNRRVMANALRVLMPGQHSGPALTLYRGTIAEERRRRRYGFSWTTDPAVAHNFAERRHHPPATEGTVLRTLAPTSAILLIRQPEDYYDEGEVVVDPFRLSRVEALDRSARAAASGGQIS